MKRTNIPPQNPILYIKVLVKCSKISSKGHICIFNKHKSKICMYFLKITCVKYNIKGLETKMIKKNISIYALFICVLECVSQVSTDLDLLCYCPDVLDTLTCDELNDPRAVQSLARSPQRQTDSNWALWQIILLSSCCLHSLCQRCMPVGMKPSASPGSVWDTSLTPQLVLLLPNPSFTPRMQ